MLRASVGRCFQEAPLSRVGKLAFRTTGGNLKSAELLLSTLQLPESLALLSAESFDRGSGASPLSSASAVLLRLSPVASPPARFRFSLQRRRSSPPDCGASSLQAGVLAVEPFLKAHGGRRGCRSSARATPQFCFVGCRPRGGSSRLGECNRSFLFRVVESRCPCCLLHVCSSWLARKPSSDAS